MSSFSTFTYFVPSNNRLLQLILCENMADWLSTNIPLTLRPVSWYVLLPGFIQFYIFIEPTVKSHTNPYTLALKKPGPVSLRIPVFFFCFFLRNWFSCNLGLEFGSSPTPVAWRAKKKQLRWGHHPFLHTYAVIRALFARFKITGCRFTWKGSLVYLFIYFLF